MLSQILTTKLQIPRLCLNLTPRPQLTIRLNTGLQQKLTLLCAPAGFGKTTLLAEWAAQYKPPIAWLSLDQGDNVPAIIFKYLIAAVQTVHPTLGKAVAVDQGTAQFSSCQSALITLINEIADVAMPFVLALENYHVIENTIIHDCMAFFLENLPQRMHLIITTRSDPVLPLARLRMRGQINELRIDDLRFSFHEADAFLQNLVKQGLSREQVTVLYRCTEGWIDGLRMAANLLRDLASEQYDTFITEFTAGNHYALDYFMEEVLDRQPEYLQNFLLQTSILDRLNSSLCQAVTGDARAQEYLKLIEKSDLFVSPLDREREWYRCHQLFAKLLAQRLQQIQPDCIPELHRRASRWYEEHGFSTEAVKHAISGQDWQRSRYLIDTNAEVMAIENQLAMLNGWVDALSAELDFAEAGGGQENTSIIEKILAILPDDQHSQHGLKALAIGRAYLVMGEVRKAEEVLSSIDLTAPDFNHNPTQIMLISILGEMHLAQGKLHLAAATYQPFLELIAKQLPDPLYFKVYGGLTRLYYEWNQLDNAQSVVDLCFQMTKQADQLHPGYIENYRWRANVLWAAGDASAANQAMQRAISLAHKIGTPMYVRRVAAHQARLWLQQNNLRNAEHWFNLCGLTAKDTVTYNHQFEYLTLARVLIAQGYVDQVLPLLTQMFEAAEAAGREGDVIEILALRALAYLARGSQTHAFSDLANALCQAEREQYIRTFVNEGAPMATLLRYAAAQGVTMLYVKNLLDAFPTSVADAETMPMKVDRAGSKTNALIEPLSARELEVLQLVAMGQSNREVAEALFIAPTTVKKHLSNIFGKLGVKNRTQAAALAREMGLI